MGDRDKRPADELHSSQLRRLPGPAYARYDEDQRKGRPREDHRKTTGGPEGRRGQEEGRLKDHNTRKKIKRRRKEDDVNKRKLKGWGEEEELRRRKR